MNLIREIRVNGRASSAATLSISFKYRQGAPIQVLGVRLGEDPQAALIPVAQRFSSSRLVRIELPELPDGLHRLTVKISTSGQEPEVSSSRFATGAESLVGKLDDDPLYASASLIDCWRKAQSQKDPARLVYRTFFNRLDLETQSEEEAVWSRVTGVDDATRAAALRFLPGHLMWCVSRRMRHKNEDPFAHYSTVPFDDKAAGGFDRITLCAAISRVFLIGAPQTDDGSIDVDRIANAFLLFARGALSLADRIDEPSGCMHATRDRLATFVYQACTPNSGFYVLFAEFAGLCVHLGIDSEVWRPLLPILTHSLNAYGRAYLGNGHPFSMQNNVTLKNPMEPLDEAELVQQRKEALDRFPNDKNLARGWLRALKGLIIAP